MNGTKVWWAIDAFITRITQGALYVSIFCLGFMMLLATVDIITTKFFNTPIPSTAEFIEDFNIPLVYLGMAFVQLKRGHISGPVFENKFSAAVNKGIKIAGCVIGVLVCGVISWRTVPIVQDMLAKGTVKLGIVSFPLWPFSMITLISFLLLGIAYVLSIVRLVAKKEDNQDSSTQGAEGG